MTIPDDLRKSARKVVLQLWADYGGYRDADREALIDKDTETVARALMAEREACAKVAEAEPELEGDPEPHVVAAMEQLGPIGNARAAVKATKKSIAAAIRKGE